MTSGMKCRLENIISISLFAIDVWVPENKQVVTLFATRLYLQMIIDPLDLWNFFSVASNDNVCLRLCHICFKSLCVVNRFSFSMNVVTGCLCDFCDSKENPQPEQPENGSWTSLPRAAHFTQTSSRRLRLKAISLEIHFRSVYFQMTRTLLAVSQSVSCFP